MTDIEFTDMTNRLPTARDVDDAIQAVTRGVIKISSLPPELGVNLPNILRCLRVAEAVIKKVNSDKPKHENP